MDAAILDLVPDDEAGISKKRATYHWDKKKKKYIRLQPGEVLTGSGKVKSESGAKVNAGQQKGLYKKWQARTHMKVATAGDEGEDRPQGDGWCLLGWVLGCGVGLWVSASGFVWWVLGCGFELQGSSSEFVCWLVDCGLELRVCSSGFVCWVLDCGFWLRVSFSRSLCWVPDGESG
jgi:hypothetical protein